MAKGTIGGRTRWHRPFREPSGDPEDLWSDDPKAEDDVRELIRYLLEDGTLDSDQHYEPAYDHDQWFILSNDTSESWNVVTCEDLYGVEYLDAEAL